MGIQLRRWILTGAVLAACGSSAPHALAALVSYTTTNYTQNFDSLANTGTPAWTNGTTLSGWFASTEGSTAPTTYSTSDGGAPLQNALLSIGTASSTDRALGAQNSNTPAASKNFRIGVALSNDNAFALSQFSLTYTGEQWRVITGETVQDRLAFSYQVFPAGTGSLTAGTWTNVTSLDFVAPAPFPPTSSTGLDGNATANRATLSQTVTGLTWAPGTELWLRWTDANVVTGSERRSMMGVDDVTFSAVPEPGTISLVAAGGLVLGYRLRRRSKS